MNVSAIPLKTQGCARRVTARRSFLKQAIISMRSSFHHRRGAPARRKPGWSAHELDNPRQSHGRTTLARELLLSIHPCHYSKHPERNYQDPPSLAEHALSALVSAAGQVAMLAPGSLATAFGTDLAKGQPSAPSTRPAAGWPAFRSAARFGCCGRRGSVLLQRVP